MKKIAMTLVLMYALIASSLAAAELFVLNTTSETVSKINMETGAVNNGFIITGMYPNKMLIVDDYVYIVNSGDNNIQRNDLNSGALLNWINFNDYSNPNDIVKHGDYLYVSGLLSDKVYKISITTYSIVAEINVGVAPQALKVYNDILYVANSGFQYPNFLPGEVSVIDLASFTIIDTIAVPTNPGDMQVDDYGNIHLICIGDYANNTGVVAIIDSETNEIVHLLDFGVYLYGIAISENGRVYIGEAYGSGVYGYDLPDFSIVYDENSAFTTGVSALLSDRGLLFVADAGDYMSNSTIKVFDSNEVITAQYTAAIGSINLAMRPKATSIEDSYTANQLQRLQVSPNPFRASIQIDIPRVDRSVSTMQRLEVYNVKGQAVRTFLTDAESVYWNGRDNHGISAPAGVYLIKLKDSDNSTVYRSLVTLVR